MNSLRNKIEAVEELIKKYIDLRLLSETKTDETFPNQQFNISNYKTLLGDRNLQGNGFLFYIRTFHAKS